MKQIFTDKNRISLLKEVQRLEDFVMNSKDNDKILNTYFPHTIYELDCILTSIIWQEVEYKDTKWFKKIK